MKLPAELLTALNDELTRERYANALYLAAAGQFEALNLTGMADWARRAAADEVKHGNGFFDYITDRNEKPILAAVEAAPSLNGDPLSIFQAALKQEMIVSEAIRSIYALAVKTGDFFTCEFLHWYLKEQVESERDLTTTIGKVQMAQGNGQILFLDHEMGEVEG